MFLSFVLRHGSAHK